MGLNGGWVGKTALINAGTKISIDTKAIRAIGNKDRFKKIVHEHFNSKIHRLIWVWTSAIWLSSDYYHEYRTTLLGEVL